MTSNYPHHEYSHKCPLCEQSQPHKHHRHDGHEHHESASHHLQQPHHHHRRDDVIAHHHEHTTCPHHGHGQHHNHHQGHGNCHHVGCPHHTPEPLSCPHHGCPHHMCSYFSCPYFKCHHESHAAIEHEYDLHHPLYTDNSADLLTPLRHIEAYTQTMTRAQETLAYLKETAETLPLFRHIHDIEDMAELEALAQYYRERFTDVIILGTGGSSLGGQALYALSHKCATRLHFVDNIDPHTFHRLFEHICVESTAVIAISKSGNTAETLMQLLICIEHWERVLKTPDIAEYFLIITEHHANAIREVAQHYHIRCLNHPHNIGGRFAVFTVVGMLPALIAGLKAEEIRKGALSVLHHLQHAESIKDCAPLRGAIISRVLSQVGCTQAVMMPYVDRLNTFSSWHRQLWAESIGKNGKGTTPLTALGTVDQHSQLQLFLDGPNDKFFTILTMNHGAHPDLKIHGEWFNHHAVSLLQGKTMGQLMMAEQQATIDTLIRYHCTTRVISIEHLNERVMGALMTHFVLETLAMAHLLEVNPFDQPAVEDGKVLTRQYLTEMT